VTTISSLGSNGSGSRLVSSIAWNGSSLYGQHVILLAETATMKSVTVCTSNASESSSPQRVQWHRSCHMEPISAAPEPSDVKRDRHYHNDHDIDMLIKNDHNDLNTSLAENIATSARVVGARVEQQMSRASSMVCASQMSISSKSIISSLVGSLISRVSIHIAGYNDYSVLITLVMPYLIHV
jgi:predicted phosphoadenosine phosphosulfate sulfurtransferase